MLQSFEFSFYKSEIKIKVEATNDRLKIMWSLFLNVILVHRLWWFATMLPEL